MATRPFAANATSTERRALRFKCFTFYGKWEPQKSIQDVNDLCEWALQNGVAVFNAKLHAKYGEDLGSITITSFLDLPLETQVKLFYAEFEPNKPVREIEDVALWAKQRGDAGIADINSRMNKKYGENLHTMAFGGRIQMRNLLEAYFRRVDPARCTNENLQITINYVAHNGAMALVRELKERYKVDLQLSVMEIEGQVHEIDAAKSATSGPPRPAVMSLMQGGDPPPVNRSTRPLSSAFSQVSSHVANWSVTEDAEIRSMMEVFYAKNNPEKLASGGVDALMKYARINGLEAVNVKLQERYGEDIDTLKVQYTSLLEQLTAFYAKVDPSKSNLEDIAAWAIVHGTQPLSERLEKRYGRGLFDDEHEMMDPERLRARLSLFYKTYDKQPKSKEDLDTIVTWALAGSISQLNKKLKDKYNANLSDLPPVAVGETVVISDDLPKQPEALGTSNLGNSDTNKSRPSTPSRKANTSVGSKAQVAENLMARDKADSFASQAGSESMDKMGEQVRNMRRITSGQYDDLAKSIRAFYRRHDPTKLENKEALDLVLKWTFKHGTPALNNKFKGHYGADLDDIELDERDDEEEEGDDEYFNPDW